MRISWITDDRTPATVHYGTSSEKHEYSVTGTVSSYQHLNYTSGQIHDVTIGPLEPNTDYYYRFAPGSTVYSFKTPPAKFPIKFAISGYNLQDFIINLITSGYWLVSVLFVTVLGTIRGTRFSNQHVFYIDQIL
ncbi:putative Acid phosphatase [Helianthus annuus]|nr:putative Acid phosphatase [Helianthus annuus]KAJ0784787.1 putative Acid phosphatase [Helianthus annuus]KAJ0794053.1 putative Acid phosphatase [Helianthus annuus]